MGVYELRMILTSGKDMGKESVVLHPKKRRVRSEHWMNSERTRVNIGWMTKSAGSPVDGSPVQAVKRRTSPLWSRSSLFRTLSFVVRSRGATTIVVSEKEKSHGRRVRVGRCRPICLYWSGTKVCTFSPSFSFSL